MATVFVYRQNRSIKNVDPQELGEELERLRSARGGLTPADVVEAAADPVSPLHPAFEWDDSAAAHQWRLTQARRVIVSVRVASSEARRVPYFVSVKTRELGRSYVPTVEAMSDDEIRERILTEIAEFVESMQRRYANFKAVGDLMAKLQVA